MEQQNPTHPTQHSRTVHEAKVSVLRNRFESTDMLNLICYILFVCIVYFFFKKTRTRSRTDLLLFVIQINTYDMSYNLKYIYILVIFVQQNLPRNFSCLDSWVAQEEAPSTDTCHATCVAGVSGSRGGEKIVGTTWRIPTINHIWVFP